MMIEVRSDEVTWGNPHLQLIATQISISVSALPLKVCHKKQEKFHPTLETIDGKEP
jgi:hypothetical protein